jgi:hypothetical protein
LLRRQKGRRLSPAYDPVPAPFVSLERRGLALPVGDYGRTASIYNLLSQAGVSVCRRKRRAGKSINSSMSSGIGATASSHVACRPRIKNHELHQFHELASIMRTTLTLEDDAFDLAQGYAEARALKLGQAISELIRRDSGARLAMRKEAGVWVFDLPADAPRVTVRQVKNLLDEGA